MFKDNHIYNFEYSETFIEEIVDTMTILEVQIGEPGEQVTETTEDELLESDRDSFKVSQIRKRSLE